MLKLNRLKRLYGGSPFWVKRHFSGLPDRVKFGENYSRWKRSLLDDFVLEEY